MGNTAAASGPPEPRLPRLTIGLPTYNGARFLEAALDALLAQTFTDFELIISDNASTDATEAICQRYQAADSRVRYVRQQRNIGSAANHNVVIDLARGEYFKWAADDDLYHASLVQRCVELLDGDSEVVLAHAADAFIGPDGRVVGRTTYRLDTHSPSPARRFRSVLYARGGNDFYGVVRTEVLRRTHRHGSHHNADRTIVAELALHGRFAHSAELLYFRRDHQDRSEREGGRETDDRPTAADASEWARQMGVYVASFGAAIRTAPLRPAQRAACYRALSGYVLTRVVPLHRLGDLGSEDPAIRDRARGSRIVRGWHRVRSRSTPRTTDDIVGRLPVLTAAGSRGS